MKKYILFTSVVFFTIASHAQIQFGIKGGLNLSNIIEPSPPFDASYNIKPGFNAGGLACFPLAGKFALQPAILYSAAGSKAKTNFDNVTYRLQYITAPLLLTYNFSPGFFAQAGPQAGLLLSARKKVHSNSLIFENPNEPMAEHAGDNKNIKQNYKSFDFSGVIGAGYHFSKNIAATASYHLSLLNTAKTNTGTTRNSVIQIDIFYLFKS